MATLLTITEAQRDGLLALCDLDTKDALDDASHNVDMATVSRVVDDLTLPNADGTYALRSLPRDVLIDFLEHQMAWVLECALDRDLLRAWHACIELFRQLGHEVEGRSTTGSSVIVRSAGERRNDWQSGAGGWTRAKTRELPGTPFGQRMSDDHARTRTQSRRGRYGGPGRRCVEPRGRVAVAMSPRPRGVFGCVLIRERCGECDQRPVAVASLPSDPTEMSLMWACDDHIPHPSWIPSPARVGPSSARI